MTETNGQPDDRHANGWFKKGHWRGGTGNPIAKRIHQIKRVFAECVTDEDVKQIVLALVAEAKKGDLQAVREVLDRLIGKPKSTIEVSERALAEQEVDQEIENAVRELAARDQASDSSSA